MMLVAGESTLRQTGKQPSRSLINVAFKLRDKVATNTFKLTKIKRNRLWIQEFINSLIIYYSYIELSIIKNEKRCILSIVI